MKPYLPALTLSFLLLSASAGAARPVRDLSRVFTRDDADVVAPVKIRQDMPRFPVGLREPVSGVLEVVIDPTGKVESARIIDPVHIQYDGLLENAAKKWQYQPATVDGTPVRFNWRIKVDLSPNVAR